MIELLILWNVAALRDEHKEDNDFSTGAIAVWIMLQILIWPISLFVLIWKKAGLRWYRALIAASAIVSMGFWLGGENFFFGMGVLAMVTALSVVTHAVLSER